jgi:peptidoglycan/LPS O-acetylase OafA/YrhL
LNSNSSKSVDSGAALNPPKPSALRVDSLDGVRGLAILAGIAFHTLRPSEYKGFLGAIWRGLEETSWSGIDLFFVLSGFLITGILLDSRGRGGYFRNFYARRTLRIFPLYYSVLFVALVLVPAVVGSTRLPDLYPQLIKNQIWLWTYLQNYLQSTSPHMLPGFGHFWSLAVEEQFYLVWPLLVYLLNRRNLMRLAIAVCIAEPLLRFTLLHYGYTTWALRQLTFTRIDTLLYGAIGAIALRDRKAFLLGHRGIRTLAAGFILALVAILIGEGHIPYEGTATVIIGYSGLGMLFSLLIFHLATTQGTLSRVFSTRGLRWFGKYSYAIFVFQWPVAQACSAIFDVHPGLSSPTAVSFLFIITTVLSAGIAYASWNMLEARFIKLKRYFEYSYDASRVSKPGSDAATVSAGLPLNRSAQFTSNVALSGEVPGQEYR